MKSRTILTLLMLLVAAMGAQAQTDSFTVNSISDEVFQRMKGRSFPEECTVKREDLRYLQVLYCDAEGVTHRGELVCNKSIAKDLVEIFKELYAAKYPIERMSLIDDYDADDNASMAANNTSCFCFRTVEGTNSLSKHALGLAIDINPLYNPWVHRGKDGKTLVSPANGEPYADRTKDFTYKLNKNDLCYKLFIKHGFTWGGNWNSSKDYQHFQKQPSK